MIVNDSGKFIFVHVYKNAGSSMERALGGGPWAHGPKKHTMLEDVPNWKDYFSFAFVRNPWDRMLASYAYKNRKNLQLDLFEQFVRRLTSTKKRLAQYNMVKNCSFIGRFEHINEDFRTICDILELKDIVLPHLVKSKHEPYAHYYTDELKDIVYKLSSGDIDHFGFTFDGTATKNIGDMR